MKEDQSQGLCFVQKKLNLFNLIFIERAMNTNVKKIVAFAFFLTLGLKAFSPAYKSLAVIRYPPIEPFSRLTYAVGMVETKCNPLAFNPLEEAAGFLQIRPIRLIDYNQRTGSKYKMDDLFNPEISEKIFLYYAAEFGPYNFEWIARTWNGSGKNTIQYWEQVKKFL
jgi:hypothetical protein